MPRSSRRIYPAAVMPAAILVAIGLGTSLATADTTDQQQQQLQQKIDRLEAKVEALEAQQTKSQANDTAQMKAVITQADQHSQLMGSMSGGAGYDPVNGLQISSDDGNFLLHPFVLFQFRGVINDRQSVGNNGAGVVYPVTGSNETDGFEVHNLIAGVSGYIVSPNLQYLLSWNTNSNGGAVTLLDGVVSYKFDNHFTGKAGQYVDPVWHDTNVNDDKLLAVDRSMSSVLLGGANGTNNIAERVQGIGVEADYGQIRGELNATDGYNTQNTPFYTPQKPAGQVQNPNFGFSGRVEYKVMGDDKAWNTYNSLSALGVTSDSLVTGAGMEWSEGGPYDNIYITLDAQYTSHMGFNIYGAVLENYAAWSQQVVNNVPSPTSGNFANTGFLVQAGYMVRSNVEVFARYDLSALSSGYANILAYGTVNPGPFVKSTATTQEITVGSNYFVYGQRCKIAADLSFLPAGSPVDAPGLGILANQNHSEWVGRIQFQLSI
jgi:hypothetical protein